MQQLFQLPIRLVSRDSVYRLITSNYIHGSVDRFMGRDDKKSRSTRAVEMNDETILAAAFDFSN